MLKYVFIIAILACAVYANTLNNDFVSDDIPTIVQRQDLGNVFRYADVSSAASSLDFLIGGRRPPVYHLTNIALHSGVSVLVFYFLLLFFAVAPSFWGAMVFAAHPIHAEAVTWISGRPYLFLAFFVLGAFLLYVRATDAAFDIVRARGEAPSREPSIFFSTRFARSKNMLFLSLIAFTLALFSWISALLFPVMVILYDLIYTRWRRTWKLWGWYFIPLAVKLYLMKSMVSQRVIEVSLDTGSTILSNPVYNMAYALFSHLVLIVWPQNLTLYHDPMVITAFMLALELFAIAVACICMPLVFKQSRALFFGLCLYVLFLSPTFSPVTVCWLVAERYAYLPSVAFSMLIAFIVEKTAGSHCEEAEGRRSNLKTGIASRLAALGARNDGITAALGARNDDERFFVEKCKKDDNIKSNRALCIFLVALIAAYSLRAIIRNRDWRTHASIWRSTYKHSPLSPKAHINMGDVYSLEGDMEKSAQEFEMAISLKPDYAEAYHNLANINYKTGKIDDAIVNYRKALMYKPSLWQSHMDLGIIFQQRGDYKEAARNFRQALELNPGNKELQNSLRDAGARNDGS